MPSKKMINVGIIQMSCSKDKQSNLEKTIGEIEKAAKEGAQIICLQEIFTSLYFCNIEDYENFKLAEPIPGPTVELLQPIAKKLQVVIIASLFEKRTEGIYHNAAAVIDADGSYLGKYRKMHIPDDPGYFEKFYFTPGDLGFKVFETRYAKIGVLICWDQWYPEAARITSLMGAEMLFYPTAIGWHKSQDEQTNQEQHQAWQTIQTSHAVANGVPVISVNRTGWEGDMQFWGGSFVTNAFGSIEYKAAHDQETTQVVAIDMEKSNTYRVHWPFLRDRRIDAYGPIEKRFIDE